MNIQSKSPALFPVDVPLVKELVTLLMVRNQPDPVKRALDKQTLTNNLETLNINPEHHLAFVMQVMDRAVQEKRPPSFDAGLMMGVCIALSARGTNGKLVLRRMAADIRKQLDQMDSVPKEAIVEEGSTPSLEKKEGDISGAV